MGMNHGGFTLIESLVALVVLTIGILAMYTMQSGSVRGNFRASQMTSASAWAADRMEQLNGLPCDDDALADKNNDGTGQDADGNGVDDDDEGLWVDGIANFGLDRNTAATADYTFTGGLEGFTMHYNIANDQPIENMKTIRVILVRNADRQQFVFDYYRAASL
jgi:prepilin-type N-terminal cleavage/methylation domain-containing protein